MRFNQLYFIILLGIVIFLGYYFFIAEKELKCNKIDELNASLTVKKGVMGFNADKDSLKFGKISPGETVKRSVMVSYSKDAQVIVTMAGDFSSWAKVTPHKFSLSANNTKEVYFEITPPNSAAEGNYTGKARFCYVE